MTRRWGIWLGTGILLVAVAIGAWSYQQYFRGSDEPQGGDITLPSTQGEFSLSEIDDDEIGVLFFGFTYCPDVCPMTLSVIRQALQRLEDDKAERIVPVLISVDPERDTLERLDEYVGSFGDAFIGVRPSEAELNDIAERYDVSWRKVEVQDSELEYTVDHTASLFLVDHEGNILERVLYSPVPNSLIAALEAQFESQDP
ncbi:SCO family protein [Aidingimonas lacisalsi]|uniref:SCO family protein n=1 Tax=Aidingimonas lacisalsi TaxID=2604086 RepID=UPI0011D2C1EA|nr:SCO family protein [Aidingimonas lacisalsi]